MRSLSLHWFQKDLRLKDNPALLAALKAGETYGLFIHEDSKNYRPLGGASKVWLHHSLTQLQKDLARLNIPLILLSGDPAKIVPAAAQKLDASLVTFTQRYEPGARKTEDSVVRDLEKHGIKAEAFASNLMHDPLKHKTQQGNFYQVYTPFWKSFVAKGEPSPPLPAPKKGNDLMPMPSVVSEKLDDWKLLPSTPDWAKEMNTTWRMGEKAAQEKLDDFLDEALRGYKENRNYPARKDTSRLSPHLHWGEISPRQIWHRTAAFCAAHGMHHLAGDAEQFLKEIFWREFSYHLLVHVPELPEKPLRRSFAAFPWERNAAHLRAWQRGMTGYPIVDAGMRELWQTGWMHNRVRMIVASFLIKDLFINWTEGEEWFWDTLLDADPANNAASWQWVAGCGADAAPYFRIFNPIGQGEKFDPKGDYIRQYVPELSKLPNTLIHRPMDASPIELKSAGIVLGKTYPLPIVDHDKARKKALALFKELPKAG